MAFGPGSVPSGVQPLAPHAYGSEIKTLAERPVAIAKDLDPTTPVTVLVELTEETVEFTGKSQPIRISWAREEFPSQIRVAKQYAKTHPFGEVKTFITYKHSTICLYFYSELIVLNEWIRGYQ